MQILDTGNDYTVRPFRDSAVVPGFGVGIFSPGRGVKIKNSTITGSYMFGIAAKKIRLRGSTVTGNMVAPQCGVDWVCGDLVTVRPPRLDKASVCDVSKKAVDKKPPFGQVYDSERLDLSVDSWGVCSGD